MSLFYREIEVGNKPKGEAGFTLVEVLVAMVLLTVALLGMLGLLTANLKGIERSENQTIASNLAIEKIEDLKMIAFNNFGDVNVSDSVAASDPITRLNVDQVEDYGFIANYGQFRREVYITDGAAPINSKDVGVVVLWKGVTGTKLVLMRTTIAR